MTKITDDLELCVDIKVRIYSMKPISKLLEMQHQLILDSECDKIKELAENILLRRLQEGGQTQ